MNKPYISRKSMFSFGSMRRLVLSVALVLLLGPANVAATERDYKNEIVARDDSFIVWTIGGSGGTRLEITVTSDRPIDIYILSSNQYVSQDYPHNFTSTHQVLNTTSARFTWTQPDNQFYNLMIDNERNNIAGSADPSGPVRFSLAIHNAPVAESTLLIAVAIVVIVIVAVISTIVIVVRKRAARRPGQPANQPWPYQYGPPPPRYN